MFIANKHASASADVRLFGPARQRGFLSECQAFANPLRCFFVAKIFIWTFFLPEASKHPFYKPAGIMHFILSVSLIALIASVHGANSPGQSNHNADSLKPRDCPSSPGVICDCTYYYCSVSGMSSWINISAALSSPYMHRHAHV